MVVIANCASGVGADIAARARAVTDAFEGTGLAVEVRCVPGPELSRVAAQLAAEKPDAIVAAGGDGTVSAVAGALAGTGVPLGVLPMGTLNHFAKDAGLPVDVKQAAAIIAAGRTHPVDVAELNGRVFVNNSSIGVYPHTVRERDAQRAEHGIGKWRAMLRAIAAVLRRVPTMRVRLEVDGRTLHRTTPLVFVGNGRYEMSGLALGKRASLVGGVLSVYHTRRVTGAGLVFLALRALFGKLDGVRDFEEDEAREVTIHLRAGNVRVALDGEVIDERPPLKYRVRPAELTLLSSEGA